MFIIIDIWFYDTLVALLLFHTFLVWFLAFFTILRFFFGYIEKMYGF